MQQTTCSIDSCERAVAVRARQWCAAHYERWRHNGTTDRLIDLPPVERFAEHVDDSGGVNSCHEWQGPRKDAGYGLFNINGECHVAHRWLLGHLRGEPLRWDDEAKELACHHCDNPPCCNPLHLYVGDHSSNQRDAYARGLSKPTHGPMKDHCKHGHEYSPENTYHRPNGGRDCRRCKADVVARWRRQTRGSQ